MRMAAKCLIFALIAACGGEEKERFYDGRPLDGYFRAQVTESKNTCQGMSLDPGARAIVEMYLRDDGLYDLLHESTAIPGPKVVEGIDRTGGLVDHHLNDASSAGRDFGLVGMVTPDGMDLNVSYKGFLSCRVERHLNGAMWPVGDPAELEGHYAVARTTLDNTCAGANRQIGAPRNTLLTLHEASVGELTIVSSEGWWMDKVRPAPDGKVDWQGALHTGSSSWPGTVAAKLRGALAPGGLQAILSVWQAGTTPDTTLCADETSLVGAKRLPSLDSVDNDYRGAFVVSEGCMAAGVISGGDRGRMTLITQPDGTVELIDPYVDMMLSNADGVLHGRDGSPPEGLMVTVDGTIASPLLSYTITYDKYQSGLWQCSKTVTVTDAHVRYVFVQ